MLMGVGWAAGQARRLAGGPLHPFNRAFYRLVYPLSARPTLELGEGDLIEVIDLSEQGVRLLVGSRPGFAVGTAFAGTLRLCSGPLLSVEGVVLRVDPPQVAAVLTRGVPFGLMLDEQRFVYQRFTARH